MRKLIVTEWMSLNGINDSATMHEWFNPYHSDSRAKSIQDTIHDCEVMLYGKNTYQMLYPYWSSLHNNEMGVAEKLNSVKKYVVSTTLTEAPWQNTSIIKNDVTNKIAGLKKEAGGNILVQGSGTLVKALMQAGLVDELKLLIQPHIAAPGTASFFEGMSGALELISLKQLGHGVIEVSYQPKA